MHPSALSELGEALRSELQTLLDISADVDDIAQLDQDAQQLWQNVEREFAALAGELTASFSGSDLIGPFSPQSEAAAQELPRRRSLIGDGESTSQDDEGVVLAPLAGTRAVNSEAARPMTPPPASLRSAPESFITQPQAAKSAASDRRSESETNSAADTPKLQSSQAKPELEPAAVTGLPVSRTTAPPIARAVDKSLDVESPSLQSIPAPNQQQSLRSAETPHVGPVLGSKGRPEPSETTAPRKRPAATRGDLTAGTPAPLQEPGVFQNVKSLRDLAQALTAGPYIEPETPQVAAGGAAPETDSSLHPPRPDEREEAAQQIVFQPEVSANLASAVRVTPPLDIPRQMHTQATNVEASAEQDHDLESILEALSRSISEEYRRFYRS